jgi:hypothetical protein
VSMRQSVEERITIMDPQVRDVILDALSAHVDMLDRQGDVLISTDQPKECARIMRKWARATAVLRMVEREGHEHGT